jgi:repressor LexA
MFQDQQQWSYSLNEKDIISIPIVGSIAAGNPIFTYEDCSETISVPVSITKNNQIVFALKVEGDSMIGDHILEWGYCHY